MRIAVVMNRTEYEAREAVLAENPDSVPEADAAFHATASAVIQAVDGVDGVDLYVEAEDGYDAGVMLTAEYLYTMEGPVPGEEPDDGLEEAVMEVLRAAGSPMTAAEVASEINKDRR